MDNSNFKLGLKPAKYDARTLFLSDYYQFPDPPEERIWSSKVSGYDMLGNDKVGDCGPAGVAHLIQTWTANLGDEIKLNTAQVLDFYSKLTGFNQRTGENDNGVILLDMLKLWRNEGINGRKIGAFMALNPRNIRMQRVGINEFGGTINGIALPVSAQGKDRWDIEGSFNGDAAPGSWGGHCTVTCDALKNGDFNNITWGSLMPASKEFMMVYPSEMYVVLSKDFVNDKSLSPSNFDWDKMTEDLSHIS